MILFLKIYTTTKMNPLSAEQKLTMSLEEIQDYENIQNINIKDGLPTLYDLSTETKMNDLEEKNESLKHTISNLLKKNTDLESTNNGLENKLNGLKKNFSNLFKDKQKISTDFWELQKDYKHLTHKYNENTEIITLYNWIIHIDNNSQEYVSGYRYNSDSIWDTTYIKEKIAMSTYLLIITENESMYCLPYCESNK